MRFLIKAAHFDLLKGFNALMDAKLKDRAKLHPLGM
jgi:hypothetical protein